MKYGLFINLNTELQINTFTDSPISDILQLFINLIC